MIDLEAARAVLGVPTQVAFAELLGMTGQHYRKLIAGKGSPSPTVERLVQAYLAGYRPDDWESVTVDRRRRDA